MTEVSDRLYWLAQALIAFIPYLIGGLVAGAVVLALSVLLARYWLWEWLLAFEKSLLLAINARSTAILDRWMFAVTLLGQREVAGPLLGLVGSLLIYYHQSASALVLGINLAGSWLLNWIFKGFFRRKRPELWASPKRPLDYSYPSGHSMSAISFYGLLAVYGTRFLNITPWLTFPLGAVLSIAVGFSRMYLGVHWPTDVLSGWAAGGIWLAACLYGLVEIGAF
ncbi:phosphatase PAP2 family protein [Leptolyngbya sp. FACHB-261]|uniref:phosphatase PAP2 family protein n=1 Tax=Leptolyngbya sp. FACHB-261 TaxID=2692806 RepID=UPI00168873B8|nr:phosphatase PAP2 family protein [Leptolyngbya sp. FACHB-261]MBD2101204.1 phosphatase PAP2 family protein [Leptolyngbya sp. FACHB-261]